MVFVFLALAAGCSAAHEPTPDASTDAPPDGPSCGRRALDVACFDTVSAGMPTAIEILAMEGGCFCTHELRCTARIESAGRLELETHLCPEDAYCPACRSAVVGTCELPALSEGTWRVAVNGEDAFDLEVVGPDSPSGAGRRCVRRAQADECEARWPPTDFEIEDVCYQPVAVDEGTRVQIRVRDRCGGGCWIRGPCHVEVVGDEVRVRASRLGDSCGTGCPPVCGLDEHVCVSPPLAAGEYRVRVEGLPSDGRLRIGGDTSEMTCIGRALP
jgi:hypothetical protein